MFAEIIRVVPHDASICDLLRPPWPFRTSSPLRPRAFNVELNWGGLVERRITPLSFHAISHLSPPPSPHRDPVQLKFMREI